MDYSAYQSFAKENLDVTFDNIELLVTAFTHRSYVNEHKKNRQRAQRTPGIFGRRRAGTGCYRVPVR